MTVNAIYQDVSYNGDGVQTDFPVTFEIIDPIQVKWTPSEGNVVETAPNSGNWVVRFQNPPTEEVHIYRDTPISQETQYNPYDAFPAEAHESALDKLTQICQELEGEKITLIDGDGRYLKLSGGSMTGHINMADNHVKWLPDPVQDQDAVNMRWYKANQIPGIQGEIGPIGPPPAVTADANAVPWESGADVTVTPDSDPYTGVHMGFQIPEGPVGVTPEFSADVTALNPDDPATVAVTQTGPPDAHAVNLSFAIPKGDQGDKGEGIDFKGEVPTVDDLPDSGNVDGEAWWVADENSLYVWGGKTLQWEDLGDIRGPQGETGDGWVSGEYDPSTYKVTFTGQSWSPDLTFTTDSLKGDAGADATDPTVGDVNTFTANPGTNAVVQIQANDGEWDFDFVIPKGYSPEVAEDGVTTNQVANGIPANVEITTNPEHDLEFEFTIPEGQRGEKGDTGNHGLNHYDFGRFVGTETQGFESLTTKPEVIDNTTMYRATVLESTKVGAIEIHITSETCISWLLDLQGFDLGHTVVVTFINEGPNEIYIDMGSASTTRYTPKGALPTCPSMETQLWALTKTERGLFINVTQGFEEL